MHPDPRLPDRPALTETPLDAAVVSVCGPVREENQDAAVVTEMPGGGVVAIVSDGMGGHRDGRRAAEIAVREIARALRQGSLEAWPERLDRAITYAHEAIRTSAIDGGATVVVAVVVAIVEPGAEWRLHLGHVGDSRAYLARGPMLLRLTADHSVVAQLVRDGHLSEEEAFHHPDRNLLARALGQAEAFSAEITAPLALAPGDRVLLTTDGLHGTLPAVDFAALAARGGSAAELASGLVAAALAAGSEDNVSVVCLDLPAPTPSSRRATRPETAIFPENAP